VIAEIFPERARKSPRESANWGRDAALSNRHDGQRRGPRAMVAAATIASGGSDILVNNVGGGFGPAFLEQSERSWPQTISDNSTDLDAWPRPCRAPIMIRADGRTIPTSPASRRGRAGADLAVYAACKRGW